MFISVQGNSPTKQHFNPEQTESKGFIFNATGKEMYTIVMGVKQMLEAVEDAPERHLIMMTPCRPSSRLFSR